MQFTKQFLNICSDMDMEPIERGGILFLLCSKYPEIEDLTRFNGLIPDGQPVAVKESLKTGTMATIEEYLSEYGAKVEFNLSPDHYVKVEVTGPSNDVFNDDRPLWRDIKARLLMDKYTRGILIKFNGKVVLYNSTEELGMESESHIPEVAEPSPAQDTILVGINDDRFEEGRAFLPKDIATDIRILLESTSTVDEFLKLV